MSEPNDTKQTQDIVLEQEEEEEDDPYNARIERTGCYQENEDLQLCFFDKKDWRLCKDEMQKFRDCFTKNKNNAGSKELLESSLQDTSE
jgi:cytochrome c oxidase assembly factor 4